MRIEAPEHVDDIVVSYADGRRLLVQAKESLKVGSEPWRTLWKDILKQTSTDTQKRDTILIAVGCYTNEIDLLRELCDRARGKNDTTEWEQSLNKSHITLRNGILDDLSTVRADMFEVVQRVQVSISPFDQIHTVGVRDHIPPSNTRPETLFSVLRDLCGGAGRIRASFTARSLAETLAGTHQIKISGAPNEGLESYLRAISSKYSNISVPGTSFTKPAKSIFLPLLLSKNSVRSTGNFEEEIGVTWWNRASRSSETFDLDKFPTLGVNRLLIEAGAGFGKTTALGALARKFADGGIYAPAVIPADSLISYRSVSEFLENHVNKDFHCSIDWNLILQKGRGVLLFDGIDELSDEDRTTALSQIGQAAALYPDAPMIVAARDGASVDLSSNFPSYRMERLAFPEQKLLLSAYLSHRDDINTDAVFRELHRRDDLFSLCSIPLFLALLTVTLPASGGLPKGRAELLERYLTIALAPQRHKSAPRPKLPLSKLRIGAETLALIALEKHEISVSEVSARTALNERFGSADGDACIDDFVQCGIVARRGSRIGFSIATVQEYLAGCALSAQPDINLSSWFSRAARRPWAQAIQFALERASNIESALQEQLDEEDDVFFTTLRIIARTVVSGGKFSNSFKKNITHRLLSIWNGHGWQVTSSVDQLLLDGLAFPPSDELLSFLEVEGSTFARGRLLSHIRNHDLTLRALRNLLQSNDIRELWDKSWHEALRPVSYQAVELLLERALQTDRLSEGVIATVLYSLRNEPEIPWPDIIGRDDLALGVRVSALWGAGLQNTTFGRHLVENFLIQLDGDRVWDGFQSAYFSTTWVDDHLENIIFGEPETSALRGAIFEELVDLPPHGENGGTAIIAKISHLLNTANGRAPLFEALVVLASFGDQTIGLEATDRLRDASLEQVNSWIMSYPYLSEDVKLAGLKVLQSKLLLSDGEGDALDFLLSQLDSSPSGMRDSILPRGPFYISTMKSISSDFVVDWTNRYLHRNDGLAEEGMFRARLVELGSGDAGQLLGLLTGYARGVDRIDRQNWGWVVTSASALHNTAHDVDIGVLWRLLDISVGFPNHSFVRQILEREGQGCTDRLSALYRDVPAQRGQIISALSGFAPHAGVSVRVSGDQLVLGWLN